MRAWRMVPKHYAPTPETAFSGEGGLYGDGRWHHQGTPITYCASSSALAVLEVLVHVEPALAPSPLSLYKDMIILQIHEHELPENWRDIDPSPVQLKRIGDAFIRKSEAAALLVPSAIVPDGTNILLNPNHADFRSITLHQGVDFELDKRLGVGG